MVAQVVQDKLGAIRELCRRYRVERLELFGSAATEEFDADLSDIDFLITYLPETDLGPWLRDYFGLKDNLRHLLGRPVDLVEAGAPKNPSFVKEMGKTRTVVYEA